MKRVAQLLLIHVCCTLLALPVGWCCWVPAAMAREIEDQESACCCDSCSAKDAPAPSKSKEPARLPKPCCTPQPALLRTLDDSLPSVDDALATPIAIAFESMWETFPSRVIEVSFVGALSPPLHVMHCVWLC